MQRVYALGPPPEDRICLFGHLKNVVVFSATGKCDLSQHFTPRSRVVTFAKGTSSLPNSLAGGDLDGYAIHLSTPVNDMIHPFPVMYM